MIDIERHYRVMFETMAQGAFFLGSDGVPLDVNSAALNLLGVTRDQFMGRKPFDPAWQLTTTDGTVLTQDQYPSAVALRTGQPVRDFIAAAFIPQLKQDVWLTIDAIPVCKESCTAPEQVFVIFNDISGRKRINEIHATRLHLMQFAISHTLEELLVTTLDKLENLTESQIGFYHFYDEETQIITLKEWSTRTAEVFCHIEGLEGHYCLEGAGVWADCVRNRQPIVHNDYASLAHRSALPEGHAPVIRELVVPVIRQDRIVAIMGVGNKPRDYSEADIETVSLFADLAWDVVETKRAEEKLQHTQAILQAAMDQSPAGIAIAEAPDGRLRYVNDAGLLIRGGDRRSLVDEVGLDQYVASWHLLDLDGRPLRTDEVPLARAVLFGETCQREFIIRRDQGEDHIVSANAAPIRNEAGAVTAAIVVFTDISDQKNAEEQTRNLVQRLVLATSSAQLGVWDWNVRENTMIWDERMCELYGICPEESPTTINAWMNGLHPEDKESAVATCQAALNGEQEFDTEFRVCHPDGKVRHLKANALVIRGGDGKAERMIGINADISDQKIAEKEREGLENRLLQAQKIESIGQLAGGVAHDFNNMLGVIMGHAEIALRKEKQGKKLTADLEQIRLAAERSADLTRQLLTFARKQTIAPKILDLNDTVSGTLKMLQRLIGENIRLSWSPASNLWPIKVDSSQMDQILANLCVNARDAINGSGNITIQTGNASFDEAYCKARPYALRPGDFVQLSISDDGCGMGKEVQDHIFEPFYTTKDVGSGTGLGLATVYGAVKQNDGFITFYSEPGVGTTFNIYLPRETTGVTASDKAQESPLVGGTETILLVEDDEMLLQMGTDMLQDWGYRILPAASPGYAMSLAQQHPEKIDLLISDMIMPVMNGRELAENLQAIRPELKVLFMSGYTADIISKQGIVEEGIHFLQKPVSLKKLTKKVREILDQS